MNGDEAFQGYWQRPDADRKALRNGWYFTSDTGYFDAEGDLFVTDYIKTKQRVIRLENRLELLQLRLDSITSKKVIKLYD